MNSLIGMLEYSKIIIKRYSDLNAIAVDMTLGKGNDSLFLADYFKKVYSFDIQQEAIELSKEKLDDCYNIEIIKDSHEFFDSYINESVKLFIYNLGYLPGFSKEITTMVISTINSLKKALVYLEHKGIIILVIYPGHPQGKDESMAIDEFVFSLSKGTFNISKYQIISSDDAPYVICIHKK